MQNHSENDVIVGFVYKRIKLPDKEKCCITTTKQ